MLTTAEIARQQAIEAENDISQRVLVAHQEIIRLAKRYPEEHQVMRDARSQYTCLRQNLAQARHVADRTDADYSSAMINVRDQRRAEHTRRYNEIERELYMESGGTPAVLNSSADNSDSNEETESLDDEGEENEDSDTLSPPQKRQRFSDSDTASTPRREFQFGYGLVHPRVNTEEERQSTGNNKSVRRSAVDWFPDADSDDAEEERAAAAEKKNARLGSTDWFPDEDSD